MASQHLHDPAGTAEDESGVSASLEPFDPAVNHFRRLGFDPGTRLDRDALERAYLERSARVHPDRFVTSAAAEQRRAMEHASALNTAYEVLRSSVRRAEYLVKLGGIDLDSSDPERGAPRPDQAFLVEMIERREALESARAQGEAALEDLRDAVEDEREGQVDAAIDALDNADVARAARCLVTARYLARLLEEIETGLEASS